MNDQDYLTIRMTRVEAKEIARVLTRWAATLHSMAENAGRSTYLDRLELAEEERATRRLALHIRRRLDEG